MNPVDPWKHQNSIIEACNVSYSRSDQQIHETCRQAADHSNSAMEAQASGSYPAAGKQQIIVTVLWKRRLVAAIQQQQIIATVLWKCRLVSSDSLSSSRQQIIATVLSTRRLVVAIQQQEQQQQCYGSAG